jgi:rhodanese-related sulfurtransferase
MRTITVQELKSKIDGGEKVNLLDVREPSEYQESNINGHLIPLGQISNGMIDDIEHLKQEEVIIHCRSGMRSMQACMILEQMGFTNTVNVMGGILAWHEAFGR